MVVARRGQLAIEARIIAVVDGYEALSADRPYRAAMAPEEALGVMGAWPETAWPATCWGALPAVIGR